MNERGAGQTGGSDYPAEHKGNSIRTYLLFILIPPLVVSFFAVFQHIFVLGIHINQLNIRMLIIPNLVGLIFGFLLARVNLLKKRTVRQLELLRRKDAELNELNRDLESKVVQRTRELTVINEELRESEGRYRAVNETLAERYRFESLILDSLPMAFYVSRPAEDNVTTWVSPQIEDLSGFAPENFIGSDNFWSSRLHPEDRGRALQGLAGIERQNTFSIEYRWQHADGDYRWIRDSAVLVRDDEGGKIIGSWLDITGVRKAEEEKRLLEEKLRHSQKMEALGTLAGGIAHDFNNILSAIFGFADVLLLNLPPGNRDYEYVQEIKKAGSRAAELVKEILTFSRQTAAERGRVQLRTLIREAIKLVRITLPSSIEIREEISEQNFRILANPTQIHQIVMNLCTNANNAMRERGGVLTVSLSEHRITTDEDSKRLELPPGEYALLMVGDTGRGMEPSVLARIFEPYFTTGEQTGGTGLGLSIVHGIVKNHDGMIEVQSEIGRGTTFRIYLPLAAVEGDLPEESMIDRPGIRFECRALLVDDLEMSVAAGRVLLEELGCQVTGIMDSLQALEVFEAAPEQFDLVITDQTMPGLSGYELAARMIRLRPDLPIILITGYNEDINEDIAKNLGIRDFLYKPLELKKLIAVLEKIIPVQST